MKFVSRLIFWPDLDNPIWWLLLIVTLVTLIGYLVAVIFLGFCYTLLGIWNGMCWIWRKIEGGGAK